MTKQQCYISSIGYTSAASTNTKQARPSATLRNSHIIVN